MYIKFWQVQSFYLRTQILYANVRQNYSITLGKFKVQTYIHWQIRSIPNCNDLMVHSSHLRWIGISRIQCCFHCIYRYPASISSLCFSGDGSLLAIASSVVLDTEELANQPDDTVYIRRVSDQETKPKWTNVTKGSWDEP